MYCFTLYWNKLQILTWSVSWAADNEQLKDTTRLNQYSCLKGMSMTIFQNLLLPCEIDKYTKRCIPPHLGLIICTWSAAAIHGTELLAAGSISFLHSLCGWWALRSWAGCILLGPPPPQVPLSKYCRCFFSTNSCKADFIVVHKETTLTTLQNKKEFTQRNITEEVLAASWMLM